MHATGTGGVLCQTAGQLGGKESSGQAFIWHLLAMCYIYIYTYIFHDWMFVYVHIQTKSCSLDVK